MNYQYAPEGLSDAMKDAVAAWIHDEVLKIMGERDGDFVGKKNTSIYIQITLY